MNKPTETVFLRVIPMKVKLNGKEQVIEDGMTVLQLMQKNGVTSPGVAVACNSEVVHQKNLGRVLLKEGDEIEIIHAVGGG